MLQGGGFTTRLSKEVLHYTQKDGDESTDEMSASSALKFDGSEVNCSADSGKYLQVTDGTLTSLLLAHMQHVFRYIRIYI